MNTINLLIVDDFPMIREGLVAMISHCPDITVIGTCNDGQEAIEAVGRCAPDVILMDIRMKNVNGLDATREIVSRYPGVKVIILTICTDAESFRLALKAGASGYILKETSRGKLVESIRLVNGGETVIDPSMLNQLVNSYTRLIQVYDNGNGFSENGESRYLTDREKEVANLLAMGLANKEICARMHLSIDTVKTHLRNIYRKIGVNNRSHAITELICGWSINL